MKKLCCLFSVSIAGLLMLSSCAKDETVDPDASPPESIATRIVGPIGGGDLPDKLVLGRKLQNPYSVSTMTRAAGNLGTSLPPNYNPNSLSQISTTHFYVKFKPQTEDELDLLKRDSTLILYDYPLDYEILQEGISYHDPAVPDSLPTYQYASIPVHRWLRILSTLTVPYEVLETLYVPDEDKIFSSATTYAANFVDRDWVTIDMLVDEALRITGNAEPPILSRRPSKWRPSGRIMYESESLGKIALKGVKVRAKRWFTTHTGTVDNDGYYTCDGRFRYEAKYFIEWERYNFAIRSSALSLAKYKGPKKRGSWDYTFAKAKPGSYFHATIFRAAYQYYYRDIGKLHRPPLNSFWKTQLKIRACYENNGNDGNTKPARRFLGLGSMIKIYNPKREDWDIYATTIHELAHAAHWGMYKSDYLNSHDFVAESWARGVEYYLTRKIYPKYEADFGVCAYTGVVVDLIDEANVMKYCWGYYRKVNDSWIWYDYKDSNGKDSYKSYFDQVTGYTLEQVEASLNGARTAKQWENNLTKLNNATKQHLPATFTFWSVK